MEKGVERKEAESHFQWVEVLQPFCGTTESSFELGGNLSPWLQQHILFITSVNLAATPTERLFIINNPRK